MTDQPHATPVSIGSRVRLRPAHNWLSKYAKLAESGRVGTVMATNEMVRAEVEFDVVRRGAQPIGGRFLVIDLILCDAPKVEQLEFTDGAR